MEEDDGMIPWVTCATILLCLWTSAQAYGVSVNVLGISYRNVMIEGQLWRVIVAPFFYKEPFHLFLNMTVLWESRFLETTEVTNAFWNDVMARKGYDIFDALSGIPLVALICAQILLDNTSFAAHGAGLTIGMLAWCGAFDWLTEYWIGCTLFWVFSIVLASIARGSQTMETAYPRIISAIKTHLEWRAEETLIFRIVEGIDGAYRKVKTVMYRTRNLPRIRVRSRIDSPV
eukprot:g327.t1